LASHQSLRILFADDERSLQEVREYKKAMKAQARSSTDA
jgi:hypothetical protein